jgi:5-methylcytosine-specific restriction enzyme A
MPNAPKRICSYPGCPVLVDSGRCDKHKKQERKEIDSRRGTAHERGYDARWRRASADFRRAHPLCIDCLSRGRSTAASVVDHIVPHRGDKVLFWDQRNWQALCKPCHDSKTAREDGRWA